MRLPDWLFLSLDDTTPAKTQWDIVVQRLGQPGYPNAYTPEGVTLAEPDSMPGKDTTHAADIEGEGCLLAKEGDTHVQIVSMEAVLSRQHTQVPDPKVHMHHDCAELDMQSRQPGDTNAHTYLEGTAPEPLMDEKEDHSLKVEEEGIAGKNASIEWDMGPCVELQHPRVSPLAMHKDIRPLTSPSSSPSTTQEAASTQCSLFTNMGMSATPDNDLAEDAEEAFCAKMSCLEDEEALDWAGLDNQPVKEGEERNADEEAGAVTTLLVEDAPHIKSKPAPHNTLHVHTPITSEAASM